MKKNNENEMPGKQPKVPHWVIVLLSPILFPIGYILGRLKESKGK